MTDRIQPTKKHPSVEAQITAANPSGRNRVQSILKQICNWCGQEAKAFRDELSEKEYSISGMCQDCQDSVFGE